MNSAKLFLILIFSVSGYAQNGLNINGEINGKIMEGDSLRFFANNLNKKYYETPIMNSVIDKKKKFRVKGTFSYPQMYYVSIKSERDKIPFRTGRYFIDESTKYIKIDSLSRNSESDGETDKEYKNTFLPYFLGDDKSVLLEKYRYQNGSEFDTKLLSYTLKHPDSYVALWNVTERFNSMGYTELYEKILNSFSAEIKKSNLWVVLNNEFKSISIKENKKFPNLSLLNPELKTEGLTIPSGKYVLVDFWFSYCRPCIEQTPTLKRIYSEYKEKGFEIIGISTDKTRYIENWQKKRTELQMDWKNYLDENAVIATKERIFAFPTNYLLDRNGIVIKKNINLEELDVFLKDNLK